MSSPPVGTAPPPLRSTPPSDNLLRLRALLKSSIRISVVDGRIFLGTFAGTDKLLNILLVNADEYRTGPDAELDGNDGRYVGQVLIPWSLVVRVESRLGMDRVHYRDSDEESMYT